MEPKEELLNGLLSFTKRKDVLFGSNEKLLFQAIYKTSILLEVGSEDGTEIVILVTVTLLTNRRRYKKVNEETPVTLNLKVWF